MKRNKTEGMEGHGGWGLGIKGYFRQKSFQEVMLMEA